MKLKRILVPVDFSHHANAAMRLAVAVANRGLTHVTVLHVDALPGVGTVAVEPIYIAPQVFEGLHAEHDARVEASLREICDDFAPYLERGVILESEHRRGNAVPGIIEFAREWEADLIVMGSQGVGGVAQMLLGSTADKVARLAPCPVLIAGRSDELTDTIPAFRHVMAAIDYSAFSVAVARLAALLVEPEGTLELLHIWHQPYFSALNASLGGEREDMRELIERARQAEADRMEAFASALDIPMNNVAQYVGVGTPAVEILNRADEVGADLIVLGAHGRSGLDERILGTVADRVLRHARVPVLLYPEDALVRTRL